VEVCGAWSAVTFNIIVTESIRAAYSVVFFMRISLLRRANAGPNKSVQTEKHGYTPIYLFWRLFVYPCLSASSAAAALLRLPYGQQRLGRPLGRPCDAAQNHRLDLRIREVGVAVPLHPHERAV